MVIATSDTLTLAKMASMVLAQLYYKAMLAAKQFLDRASNLACAKLLATELLSQVHTGHDEVAVEGPATSLTDGLGQQTTTN